MNNKISGLIFLFYLSIFSALSAQRISLNQFPKDKIMVVAHRADWREAPENSIWAIKKAIEKGVNMVELDVAKTKDNHLILMHDKTLDRTTTGQGDVSQLTLEQIKALNLKDGLGVKTQMQIPTLEEVLDVTKDKVLINLDKGFDYIDQVYSMLKERKMLDQVLFKGVETYKEFDRKYGNIKSEIHFMPIIRLESFESWQKINEYLETYKVYGFELIIGNDESKMINLKDLKNKNVRIWVNALWPHHNAHHEDDKALENPNVYQWYIDNFVSIIQSDRPKELIQFLKSKNLYYHN